MKKDSKKGQVSVSKRSVMEMSGSLCITLPKEFTDANNIKKGDKLPVIADHILKVVPMPEMK